MVESGPFGQGLEEVQRFQRCRPASAREYDYISDETSIQVWNMCDPFAAVWKTEWGKERCFFGTRHQCWGPQHFFVFKHARCSVFIIELLKVIESPESWQVLTFHIQLLCVSWVDWWVQQFALKMLTGFFKYSCAVYRTFSTQFDLCRRLTCNRWHGNTLVFTSFPKRLGTKTPPLTNRVFWGIPVMLSGYLGVF